MVMERLACHLALMCSAILLGACSQRQMYEGLHAGKRQQCQKLAEPDRSRCLESASTGYDEYQRDRDKLGPQ